MDFSGVCMILSDVGFIELPGSLYHDDDIDYILSLCKEEFKLGPIEIVALPDCYFLYVDNPFICNRYLQVLEIKINDLEHRLTCYNCALKNASRYIKDNCLESLC